MTQEWSADTPGKVGWYVTEHNPAGKLVRHWSDAGWSAPCYIDDTLEGYRTAMDRRADDPLGVVYLSDSWFTLDMLHARIDAPSLLAAAARHMRERAAAYDQPEGERSMGRTVAAFNAITGHRLRESEGWLLMELLKAVRDFTTDDGHADSQEDRIAYAALAAEARRAGR